MDVGSSNSPTAASLQTTSSLPPYFLQIKIHDMDHGDHSMPGHDMPMVMKCSVRLPLDLRPGGFLAIRTVLTRASLGPSQMNMLWNWQVKGWSRHAS